MEKLKIKWTLQAVEDGEKAFDYLLREGSPDIAKKITTKLLQGIEQIRIFPESGKNGRVSGTRELVIPTTPFIVIYSFKKGRIEILSILHHARTWP